MVLNLAQEEGNVLLRAAQWIESLIQGPLVVSIAVLAIAAVGFSMLSGRISARRGLTVVLGCFVVFGAPVIANGIASAELSLVGENHAALPPGIITSAPQFTSPPRSPPSTNADPYAGASVER